MTVQQFQRLHQRYVDLSGRFRRMWTYHQLLQGLHRLFPNDVTADYVVDFQGLYSRLKEVSQNLGDSDSQEVSLTFDGIESELDQITTTLLEEDSRVRPSLLRRFFQHVKNYDEKVFTQLVRFLLQAEPGQAWKRDRLDKLDFLLTKLAREMAAVHPGQLPTTIQSLRSAVELPNQESGAIEEARARIMAFSEEVIHLATFDDLNRSKLIARYRSEKEALGSLFFEPPVLLAILDTNRTLGDRVEELYRQEERAIFAETQRLSDIGRKAAAVDDVVGDELAQLESEIERFESSVRQGNVRIADVVTIRDRLSSLLPHIGGEASGDEEANANSRVASFSAIDDSVESWTRPVASEGILSETLGELIAALEGADRSHDARAVTLERELFSFRLEPREVTAYRNLSSGMPCDRDLEAFIMKGAALRRRLNRQAEEITGLLDESSVTGDAPVFAEARQATDLADAYLRLFGHAQDRAILSGDIEEARNLKVLMMRLMRDYSGVWLLSRRPLEKSGG